MDDFTTESRRAYAQYVQNRYSGWGIVSSEERAVFIRSLRTGLRDYLDAIVREPMSQRWVDLMHILIERDRRKMQGADRGRSMTNDR